MPEVGIEMPQRALFAGSYHRLPVRLEDDTGITLADLEFQLPDGGGLISMSPEPANEDERPSIMLLVGSAEGNYTVQAVEKASGDIVGRVEFHVSTLWPDYEVGPSQWICGDYELTGVTGAVWGGGLAGPDYAGAKPALGTRTVHVVLVDTSSERFARAETQTLRTSWNELVFSGFQWNGKATSVDHYYREASGNQFNIQGQVVGPVSLAGVWEDYHQPNGQYRGNLWQACVSASDSLIDFDDGDTLVCVMKSVSAAGMTPGKRVWPHADAIVAKTKGGDKAIGTVDIHADGNQFELTAILAHELGHNLGLGDQYAWSGHTPYVKARAMGGWDLMANHAGLPHVCLAHRLLLGWVADPEDQLRLYNFQQIGGALDETIELAPVQLHHTSTGRYRGAEVRIAPGWDYYFEYRAAQPTHVGDQSLPANQRVLGTDVTFADDLEAVSRRKPVMLLPNDIDGDGPVLGPGQDYEEQDVSPPDGPSFPTDFRVEVTNVDDAKASLHVQYGVHSQPDPSIRPWSPPPWQSPDIEVNNERNKVDPVWKNCPWENHLNTVVARVTNRGAMNAPNVHVDFYVKDLTVNNPAPAPIRFGTDQHDVDAGATVDFEAPWRAAAAGHYCIEVRIRHYQTPGANPVIEATEYNNRAQSNYGRWISKSASSPSRETTSVQVSNPFDMPGIASLDAISSTSPLYRTYIEHSWFRLQPHETRSVQVMYEFAYDEDDPGLYVPDHEMYLEQPNDVSIAGRLRLDDGGDVPVLLGGISAQVVRGRAVEFHRLAFDPPRLYGEVRAVDNHEPVGTGMVLLTVMVGGDEVVLQAPVSEKGLFDAELPARWEFVQAYLVPPPGYADVWSELIHPR